jgi:hypothetical protein
LRPFIIAHPLPLRMKVQTWLGKVIIWNFGGGETLMPLRKIFASPAPVLIVNGEPTATTVTSVQISY